MLIAVVTIFATLWLPHRGMLVYNTVAALVQWEGYMDLWFLMFAKTCIYINRWEASRIWYNLGITIGIFLFLSIHNPCYSAINPMLYSLMSTKFRRAFRRILWCRQVCWIYSVYSKDEILRNIKFGNGTFSLLKTHFRLSTGPNGHRQPLVEAFREYWILWKNCEIPWWCSQVSGAGSAGYTETTCVSRDQAAPAQRGARQLSEPRGGDEAAQRWRADAKLYYCIIRLNVR